MVVYVKLGEINFFIQALTSPQLQIFKTIKAYGHNLSTVPASAKELNFKSINHISVPTKLTGVGGGERPVLDFRNNALRQSRIENSIVISIKILLIVAIAVCWSDLAIVTHRHVFCVSFNSF